MKTTAVIPILIGLFILLISTLASANDKYTEAMKENIEKIYGSSTPEEIQEVVNTFQRIGDAEKNKWEPYYYAAYGNLMLALREKESSEIDQKLDEAAKALGKAKGLAPGESELAALEGFIHMMRVSVDPANRGQQYSGLAFQAFGKALAINPDNPRALTLMSRMQYGMAQFFGSDTREACDTAKKALEKFDTYKSENELAPTWGKNQAQEIAKGCN